MENDRPFLYRTIAEKRRRGLKLVQQRLAQHDHFEPTDTLHLTILGQRATRRLRKVDAERVVKGIPPSAAHMMRLPHEGIKVVQNHKDVAHYILSLSDPENVFLNENRFYQSRIARRLGNLALFKEPHVTLGRIDPSYVFDIDEDEILQDVPEVVVFNPMIKGWGGELSDRRWRDEPASTPPVLSNEHVHIVQPRIVQPRTIPRSFLATLARHDAEE